MIKVLRRVFTVLALAIVAIKGVFSFLSWVEKQEDPQESLWNDDEEYEDA
jgi:hypothetical protein